MNLINIMIECINYKEYKSSTSKTPLKKLLIVYEYIGVPALVVLLIVFLRENTTG